MINYSEMKKIESRKITLSWIIFISALLLFAALIFVSSPYRALRPYSIFGKKSAPSNDTITISNRTVILIPNKNEDFYIDQNLVTISDYKACVKAGLCLQPHYRDNYTNFYSSFLYNSFPVSFVTWDEARIYCQSQGGDLPTNEQWQTAAGTGRYAWGDSEPSLSLANLDGYYQFLTPAGWLPKGATRNGILDLNGNLREWILDEVPGYDSTAKGLKGGGFQDAFSLSANDQTIPHWQYSAGFNRGFRCVYPANILD